MNALIANARYFPTRRLALLITLASPIWLLTATGTGKGLALGICALIIVAVLSDGLAIPGNKSVAVQRRLPHTVGTGECVEGEYTVESDWPINLKAVLHCGMTNTVIPDHNAYRIKLSRQSTAKAQTKVTGRIRGHHPLGNTALEIYGPLGLVKRFLIQNHTDSISVIPGTPGLARFRLMAIQHKMRAVGQRAIKMLGSSTTFAGLREYVPGDDQRYVDWKATARRDRLMVRDFTIEQGQTVMLAIDAGRMMAQMHEDRSKFEHALSAALTLASVAIIAGDRVGLIVFNDEVREYVPPMRGDGAIKAIREALTRSQATLAESDYAAAFRTMAARHRRRSLIVLFTDVIDPRSSRAVIAHTSRGATKHLILVVALQNDALMSAALPQSKEYNNKRVQAASVFENVAAEELVLARKEALAAMQQAGAFLVDTPRPAATTALVNAYLEIKAKSGL